jgi:hypothetical protein
VFDHPEIFVCGLNGEQAVHVLNAAGEAVRKGERFSEGAVSDNVLAGGFKVAFAHLPLDKVGDDAGECLRRYGDDGFEAVQMFWPDGKGPFPWDEGCDPRYALLQQRPFDTGRDPQMPETFRAWARPTRHPWKEQPAARDVSRQPLANAYSGVAAALS